MGRVCIVCIGGRACIACIGGNVGRVCIVCIGSRVCVACMVGGVERVCVRGYRGESVYKGECVYSVYSACRWESGDWGRMGEIEGECKY